MLLGYSSVQEAASFKTCLDQFGQASGLEVNAQMYQVFFFNTSRITRRNIIRILGFSEGTLPSKFLGTPLINATTKKESCYELLDNIKKRLGSWTLRPLNLPGL